MTRVLTTLLAFAVFLLCAHAPGTTSAQKKKKQLKRKQRIERFLNKQEQGKSSAGETEEAAKKKEEMVEGPLTEKQKEERNKLLAEIERREKETIKPLKEQHRKIVLAYKRELSAYNRKNKQYDALVKKKSARAPKYKEEIKAHVAKMKDLKSQADEINFVYVDELWLAHQEKRKVMFRLPLPDDQKFQEYDGALYTAAEIKQMENQKAKVAQEAAARKRLAEIRQKTGKSARSAADNWMEKMKRTGHPVSGIRKYTYSRETPHQMANQPPVPGVTDVLYRVEYVSKAGIVMEKLCFVTVAKSPKDGFWAPTTAMHLLGVQEVTHER